MNPPILIEITTDRSKVLYWIKDIDGVKLDLSVTLHFAMFISIENIVERDLSK